MRKEGIVAKVREHLKLDRFVESHIRRIKEEKTKGEVDAVS